MVYFNEYTGWKDAKRKAEKVAKRKEFFTFVGKIGLAVVAAAVVYGMMWLGAALDFIYAM